MPKTKLSLAERNQLLEETKQRQRLQQEARTIKRIEELDIEACERLGRQLQLEHKELNGELECSETDSTARQYTLYLSDVEEDVKHSSTVQTVSVNKSSLLLETPD